MRLFGDDKKLIDRLERLYQLRHPLREVYKADGDPPKYYMGPLVLPQGRYCQLCYIEVIPGYSVSKEFEQVLEYVEKLTTTIKSGQLPGPVPHGPLVSIVPAAEIYGKVEPQLDGLE